MIVKRRQTHIRHCERLGHQCARENPRREEFSCGGCSMAVTLEQVNRIRYHDEVNTCNFCGRILHFANSSHTVG